MCSASRLAHFLCSSEPAVQEEVLTSLFLENMKDFDADLSYCTLSSGENIVKGDILLENGKRIILCSSSHWRQHSEHSQMLRRNPVGDQIWADNAINSSLQFPDVSSVSSQNLNFVFDRYLWMTELKITKYQWFQFWLFYHDIVYSPVQQAYRV